MTLHLSRLRFDLRRPGTRKTLADLHQAHQLAMSGFGHLPGPGRATAEVLWRWELGGAEPIMLVQSGIQPDWTSAVEDLLVCPAQTKDISGVTEMLASGATYAFSLVANPTRKIDTKSVNNQRRNGRRVPLRTYEDQIRWLERQAQSHGWQLGVNELGVPAVTTSDSNTWTGRRDSRTLTIETVRFEGLIEAREPQAASRSITSGIGPAKAYGCGLLMLARAQ